MRIAELIDRATRLRSEDKVFTYNELSGDDMSLEDLASLWIQSQEWATAARAVEKAIGEELAGLLGDSVTASSVTASGHLVWLGVSSKEECVDTAGFFGWLEENPSEISKAFNANTARKGSLPPAVRSTFFEKTQVGEPKMQAAPLEVLEMARQKKANA